ncbi:hypothetical protein C8D88_11692 [Lentzea atacamensis]|uniref:Uncharacterized protein n=1 Tax=Lentzea atacamensis TaxID=531938 RepID=A0A316HKC6_9PSEU|nr:hypothetical protein [Lentzea atacamensis]PWK81681.1 hypothetical protein C8D88_11692 [Lentzea atacamensis]
MNQDQRDAMPTPARPATSPLVLAACWAGREPAERLTRGERDLLFFDLWRRGWSDLEIAVHMKESTYTTCRIRERLGLEARRPSQEAA